MKNSRRESGKKARFRGTRRKEKALGETTILELRGGFSSFLHPSCMGLGF